ncbi:unnamed protein product [Durusdinium trenchii]|uniref:Uncharacterized protein n=1 Tax=Durusdinium trenchii TaxID=1381693 RepID=A0ABP0JN01_9DINO
MHTLNLGLLFASNGSSLKMLCQELLWWGPGDFQSQLDSAYGAFKAYCRARKIAHSQPAFTVKLVEKKSKEVLMTCKAFNGRLVLSWLAFELQTAAGQPRFADNERLTCLESSAASLLDLFRERVDYTVEASAERTSASPLRGDLRQLAEHVAGYLDNDGKKAVNAIISGTVDDVLAQHGDEELFAEQEEEKEPSASRRAQVVVTSCVAWTCSEGERTRLGKQLAKTATSRATKLLALGPLALLGGSVSTGLRRLEGGKPPSYSDLGGRGRHFRPAKAGPQVAVQTALAEPVQESWREECFPYATDRRWPWDPAVDLRRLWASQNFHRGEEVQRLRAPVAVLEWTPQEPLEPESSLTVNGVGQPVGVSPQKSRWGGKRIPATSGDRGPWSFMGWLERQASISPREVKATDSRGCGSTLTILYFHYKGVKALLTSLGVAPTPELETADDPGPSEVDLVLHAIVERPGDDPAMVVFGLKEVSPEARALRRCDAVEAEPGRFYALLSLGEAEGVRALMHRRPLPCHAALRLLRREPLGLTVLDATKGYEAQRKMAHETGQCRTEHERSDLCIHERALQVVL